MKKKINVDIFFKKHKDPSLWNNIEDALLYEKGK